MSQTAKRRWPMRENPALPKRTVRRSARISCWYHDRIATEVQ